MKKEFFYGLAFFVWGLVLAFQHLAGFFQGVLTFLLAAALLMGALVKEKYFFFCSRASFLSLLLAAGILLGQSSDRIPADSIYHHIGSRGVITGEIIPYTLKSQDEKYASFLLKAHSFYREGANYQISGNLKVGVYNLPAQGLLSPGQLLSVEAQLKPLAPLANPGQLDMLSYEYRRDIFGSFATRYQDIALSEPTPFNLLAQLEQLIAGAKARVGRLLPVKEQNILFGMLFGGYDGIERELVQQFSASGIIHILAVSGAHVAIVSAFLFWLGKRAGLARKKLVFLTLLGIFLYSLLTGLRIPVVRAGLVAALILLGELWERKADREVILGLVFLLCLFYQPLWLLDISFQLSFLAAAGIIFLAPRLKNFVTFLPESIAAPLVLTISVQLALLPFLAAYFYQVSLVAALANLLVLPFLEICLILSLLALPLLYLSSSLAALGFFLVSMLLGLALRLNAFLAHLNWAVYQIPHFPWYFGAAYYLAFFILLNCLPFKLSRQGRLASAGLVLLLAVLAASFPAQEKSLELHFLDVGQGEACLIRTENGKNILLDTGLRSFYSDYNSGERVILPYFKYYGIRELDLLILSHGHKDHAGGAAALARQLPIKEIWLPQENFSEEIEQLLYLSLQSEKVIMHSALQKEIDGVEFKVLYAPEFTARKKTLETSSVVKVSYKEQEILFTGDAPQSVETLLEPLLTKELSVLKVGHHGAKTSSSASFLARTKPALAVISVGAQNSYGHPAPETLANLAKYSGQVARTDQDGAVLVRLNGQGLSWYGYKKQPEFFQR